MTDNGSACRSKLFAQALRNAGLHHIRTCLYTPRTNRKAERFRPVCVNGSRPRLRLLSGAEPSGSGAGSSPAEHRDSRLLQQRCLRKATAIGSSLAARGLKA